MTCVSDTHENTKLYPCIYIVSHVHPSAFKLIFMQTNLKKKRYNSNSVRQLIRQVRLYNLLISLFNIGAVN